MNRAIIAAALCLAPVLASAACEPREYAQYKDEAATASGQRTLAHEACLAQQLTEIGQSHTDRALRAGDTINAGQGLAQSQACITEKSKMVDALLAAKAHRAIRFINRRCEGAY